MEEGKKGRREAEQKSRRAEEKKLNNNLFQSVASHKASGNGPEITQETWDFQPKAPDPSGEDRENQLTKKSDVDRKVSLGSFEGTEEEWAEIDEAKGIIESLRAQ
ncbi:hypothetical protein N7517_006303 [Penicillium concentricum]|uniref:Uncharacterized protein n=1 Tax=Penicillium concentricum TaxID=293559 RepID=A0A9W9S9Z3_9EURO|nr:uncharacterized protein N7517_006303 [Penicillium concentricum]KAJ5374297.1 hypothetical protein N7517_006303 [Penicillium concentricum]